MKVNVDKTKIVVFSKGRLPRNLIFNYNGTYIEIVKDFNYLGIVWDLNSNLDVFSMQRTYLMSGERYRLT
jgi:6-phosphogluconolactonase (cycloisomerase 2 family)